MIGVVGPIGLNAISWARKREPERVWVINASAQIPKKQTCDGWGPWGEWTQCENGKKSRNRSCIKNCIGEFSETVDCDVTEEKTLQSDSNSVAIACVLGFIVGTLVGAGLVYWLLVRRRILKPYAVNSPQYVSAKSQNLYVSLPMLDLKHKPFGGGDDDDSPTGTIRSTTTAGSTLRSHKNSVNSIYRQQSHHHQQDYDSNTATIKRNRSHRNSSLMLNNGHNTSNAMRADLDSDQLFN